MINKKSIIMICEAYHYVINLDIGKIFYIILVPVYPGSFAIGSIVGVNSEESGFSLLHRSSSPLSMMDFDRTLMKSSCFISTIPVHFIYSTIKSASNILFSFHLFLFSIQFCSPLKNTTCSTLKGHKQREIC